MVQFYCHGTLICQCGLGIYCRFMILIHPVCLLILVWGECGSSVGRRKRALQTSQKKQFCHTKRIRYDHSLSSPVGVSISKSMYSAQIAFLCTLAPNHSCLDHSAKLCLKTLQNAPYLWTWIFQFHLISPFWIRKCVSEMKMINGCYQIVLYHSNSKCFNHFLSFSNNESSFTDEFSKGSKRKRRFNLHAIFFQTT